LMKMFGKLRTKHVVAAMLFSISIIVFSEAMTRAALPSHTSFPQVSPTPPPPPPPRATPTPRDTDREIQDDDIVRVETDLTNVLFTIVDRNRRFVTNLRREDIRIFEDNVPQEIFTFQQQTDLPLSLAIVIDRSFSQQFTLPAEKAAARAFVDSVMRAGRDEMAVVAFTGVADLIQGLTGNPARVRSAIDSVEFVPPSGITTSGRSTGTPPISDRNQRLAGSTALWDAIWATSEEVLSTAPDRTRRAMILLTDGIDSGDSQVTMREAIEHAIRHDVTIYSIGINYNFDGVDEGKLRRISNETGGRAYFPDAAETDLRAAFAQIEQDLRSQYLVAYTPTNRARDGRFRQVRIEVINPELARQNLRLTYRQGYFARGSAQPQTAPRR
jgi:Ca-activated chloride channel homolog